MSVHVDDPEPATRLYRHRPETVSANRGSGDSIVFSHGTLMDWTMFEPQLAALSASYRTVAYNHRARTDHAHQPYDLDDLVDDCRTLIDAMGIDSTVLAGMSMGGFMALRFALTYPDALEGLVLVDTMAAPHTEDERAEYEGMIELTREAEEIPADLVELVSHLLFGQTTIAERPDLVEHWTERWQTYPGEAIYHETKSWLHRPGVEDRLDEIDVPVLVLHGEEDASIEPERAEPMAEQLPNERMKLVPNAGHSSNLENPGFATDAIEEILAEAY